MRVLFLPNFPIEGGSSRFRVFQYISHLKDMGVGCRIIERSTGRSFIARCVALLRELVAALFSDVVFVQKRFLSRTKMRLLSICNKNIIFDFDDAIYTLPESVDEVQSIPRTREERGDCFNSMIARCRLVIAGNYNLAEHARQYNSNTVIIPTPVDTKFWQPPPARPSSDRAECVTIGWIGTEGNFPYLASLEKVFDCLGQKYGSRIVLKVISNGHFELSGALNVINEPWSVEAEAEGVRKFDIGIMPLSDTEWARGKCSYKALICMAIGVPTVISPVGMNCEIVRDGENGFLALSDDEWINKLSKLIDDEKLRRTMGIEGRKTVEEKYSIEVNLPLLVNALRAASAPRVHGTNI